MSQQKRKVLFIRTKKSASGKSTTTGHQSPNKIVWAYRPLKLPYTADHLTDEQINAALDKLPA